MGRLEEHGARVVTQAYPKIAGDPRGMLAEASRIETPATVVNRIKVVAQLFDGSKSFIASADEGNRVAGPRYGRGVPV